MKNRWQLVRALYFEESGQDLIEYAMIAALVALVALGAMTLLGKNLHEEFYVRIVNALNNI